MSDQTTTEPLGQTQITMSEEEFNRRLALVPKADLTLAQWEIERTKRIVALCGLISAAAQNPSAFNIGYGIGISAFCQMLADTMANLSQPKFER